MPPAPAPAPIPFKPKLAPTQTTPEDAYRAAMPKVSPAMLEAAIEDPKVFVQLARGELYALMARMRADYREMTIDQKLRYMRIVASLADLDISSERDAEKRAAAEAQALSQAQAQLPQINIVVPQYAADYRPALPAHFAREQEAKALLEALEGPQNPNAQSPHEAAVEAA